MNKTFFKSTDDSFGKGFHEEKVNLYLEYLNKNKGPKKKKKEQMAGPSVVEAVQHNQPTTRYLVYYHEVWCRIKKSLLVSTVDNMGSQQWR